MQWALGRRALILSAVLVAAVLVILALGYAAVPEPSCTDGMKNQDEEGLDCGGSCARICEEAARAPVVSFSRLIPQNGRTDLVFYIENPERASRNEDAAFSYAIYSERGDLIASSTVPVYLPPQKTVPVFVPGVLATSTAKAKVFVELADLGTFIEVGEGAYPAVESFRLTDATTTPKLSATILYDGERTIREVPVVATVFTGDVAIGVSATVLSRLVPGVPAEAVFSWRTPFPRTPERVEILPVLP